MAVAAAYAGKQKTGLARVLTPLFEAGITHTYWQSAIALATGNHLARIGASLNAPYQAFATADGYINIGAANQRNWLRLLDVIHAPELNDDPGLQTT